MKGTGRRVLVAMSGGVDSSAAVHLLREQGYDCVGATMELYGTPAETLEDARAAAERLQQQLNCFLELRNALPNDAKEELVRGYLAANQMLDYLFEQTKGE